MNMSLKQVYYVASALFHKSFFLSHKSIKNYFFFDFFFASRLARLSVDRFYFKRGALGVFWGEHGPFTSPLDPPVIRIIKITS